GPAEVSPAPRARGRPGAVISPASRQRVSIAGHWLCSHSAGTVRRWRLAFAVLSVRYGRLHPVIVPFLARDLGARGSRAMLAGPDPPGPAPVPAPAPPPPIPPLTHPPPP